MNDSVNNAIRTVRGHLEMESAQLYRKIVASQDEVRRLTDRKLQVDRDITALAHVSTSLEKP